MRINLRSSSRASANQRVSEPASRSFLRRKCACGNHTVAGDECETCRRSREEETLRRAAISAAPVGDVPPVVHDVLSSPGQPLDSGARAFMEPRFDHDFSHVRVHTDARAAESARAVNALAYTVGRDVVFGPNQYAPNTWSGRRLLAHELVHTIQQNNGEPTMEPRLAVGAANAPEEREADRAAENALRAKAQVSPVGDIMLRRTIGDGHDLTSPRFAGDTKLEAAYDDETLLSRARDSRGTPVRLIQESLLDMGYSLPVYGADGIYGKETEKAVLQFQIDKGAVKLDGIVGPETMGLLDQYDPLGAGPKPVPPTPGGVVTLEEIDFISDHYLLKDNETASWEDTGSLYPFPEWSSTSPGGISAPISQQKATWIWVGVKLGVPVGTSGTYTLEGSSSQIITASSSMPEAAAIACVTVGYSLTHLRSTSSPSRSCSRSHFARSSVPNKSGGISVFASCPISICLPASGPCVPNRRYTGRPGPD